VPADKVSSRGSFARHPRPIHVGPCFATIRARQEFRIEELGRDLAEMHLGDHSFLLQNYYVEQWAGNFMMHMLVDDLPAWWAHVSSLDLASRYGVQPPRPPKHESWGLEVAYLVDPSGVLWHIAGTRK
jgi:hypothetical protein